MGRTLDTFFGRYEGESSMKTEINKDYFAHARVGLFTHYTYATYAGKGDNWGGPV